jgi:hypothetical protein
LRAGSAAARQHWMDELLRMWTPPPPPPPAPADAPGGFSRHDASDVHFRVRGLAQPPCSSSNRFRRGGVSPGPHWWAVPAQEGRLSDGGSVANNPTFLALQV